MFLKSSLVLATKMWRSVWSWVMSGSSAVGYPHLKDDCNYREVGQVSKRVSYPEASKLLIRIYTKPDIIRRFCVKRDPRDDLDTRYILGIRLPFPNMMNVHWKQ
jgi:hypothetical protein